MQRDIARFDLNLLRLFEAVMSEGSITRGGARLMLSQPATSNALKRLREYCGDPLFVRTPRGLKPTPMAVAILPTVRLALAQLQGAVDEYRSFDPARSTRSVNVLVIDVGEMLFMPKLIAHLHATAPGVRIVCRHIPRDRYAEALATGEADLALGEVPPGQLDLVQQHLFDEPLVCALGRNHPAEGPLTREQFLQTPQVCMSGEVIVEGRIARALGKDIVRRHVVLEVQHYSVIPMVLAEAPLLAVIPATVADAFKGFLALRTVTLPYRIEPVHVQQFWHRRSQHDAGHQWLRKYIAATFMRPAGR